MRLTIDTSVDKPEDIRKAIRFLEGFIEGDGTPPSDAALMDMFSDDAPKAEDKEDPKDSGLYTILPY